MALYLNCVFFLICFHLLIFSFTIGIENDLAKSMYAVLMGSCLCQVCVSDTVTLISLVGA